LSLRNDEGLLVDAGLKRKRTEARRISPCKPDISFWFLSRPAFGADTEAGAKFAPPELENCNRYDCQRSYP
jgi:hypothetical protein